MGENKAKLMFQIKFGSEFRDCIETVINKEFIMLHSLNMNKWGIKQLENMYSKGI